MVDKVSDLAEVGRDQVGGEQGQHLLHWWRQCSLSGSLEVELHDGKVWTGSNEKRKRWEALHLVGINHYNLNKVNKNCYTDQSGYLEDTSRSLLKLDPCDAR